MRHALLHEFVTLNLRSVAGTTGLERRSLVDQYWRIADPAARAGPGAETFLEFAQRVDCFRSRLGAFAHRTVIFGHGMWFALLLWRTIGFPVNGL